MDFPRLPFLSPRKGDPPGEVIVVLRGIQAALEAIQVSFDQLELPWSGPAPAVEDPRVAALEGKISELTIALADGVQRVQRSENRVRHIVAGARRDLADAGFEHAGVEAEATELREIDGDGGKEEPVPTVHEDVGQREHSVVPGVTVRQMQVARARRR